jgi:hypothetical protein
LAIGKSGGLHRISFKSNYIEILLLNQVKLGDDYQRTTEKGTSEEPIKSIGYVLGKEKCSFLYLGLQKY